MLLALLMLILMSLLCNCEPNAHNLAGHSSHSIKFLILLFLYTFTILYFPQNNGGKCKNVISTVIGQVYPYFESLNALIIMLTI